MFLDQIRKSYCKAKNKDSLIGFGGFVREFFGANKKILLQSKE
jgi:hypothetical protein